jgi:hypothetical protein
MRRTLIVLVLTACGGPAKPTTPPPPLSDPKPDAEKPAQPTADVKPKPPVKDPDPIDVPLSSAKTSYKLVNAGKGQKAVMKIGGEKGMKQTVELALDFAGKQVAPAELGGTQEDVAPTLVLASDVEVVETDASGAKFKVSFTGVDARDKPGAKATKEQFKTELGVLQGTVLSGVVSPTGQVANMTLHVDKPSEKTMAALELVRISMVPLWPVVPTEAIGVGAKWTVTAQYTIADRIEATQTTDMELISHKGKDWVVKGKTTVKGADQKIKDTQFEKIGGSGSFEATVTEGVFAPASNTKLSSDFTATIDVDQAAGKPVDPKAAKKNTASVQFHLDQGVTVTAKP